MSIDLFLWQVSSSSLKALRANSDLLRRRLHGVIEGSFSTTDGLRGHLENVGIRSVDDFVAQNPYVANLDPDLKKQALRRLASVFRSSGKKKQLVLSLDKSWHGLHYLLSGETWTGDSRLGRVLMGGTEIGDESCDTGYGRPRFHSPKVVREIAEELPTVAQLEEGYDPVRMAEVKIYAFNSATPQDEWEYLSHFYEKMVKFFQDAGKNGRAVIVFST